MSPFLRQLRRARILLVFAALLLITAQWLPWERMPVLTGGIEVIGAPVTFGLKGTARSQLSPIRNSWDFEHPHPGEFYAGPLSSVSLDEPATISWRVRDHHRFPKEVEVYQAVDLGMFAKALMDTGSFRSWYSWAAPYLVAHLLTFIGLIAMPFLAVFLARAHPLLWLIRFSACSVLTCLIGNLIFHHQEIAHSIHIIGSGYWLTLAALAVEITALFLIPNAAKDRLAQSA